jgi:hypothetical protein
VLAACNVFDLTLVQGVVLIHDQDGIVAELLEAFEIAAEKDALQARPMPDVHFLTALLGGLPQLVKLALGDMNTGRFYARIREQIAQQAERPKLFLNRHLRP